jgi:peptidoglycan/xylan/chitin deacetylase (PgdA/CDA1 family)
VDEVEAVLDTTPATGAVLGWDDLRRLAAEGLAVAPHTCTHAPLDRLEPAAAEEEIIGSARRLAQELGSAGAAFAYPGGAHSETVVGSVRRQGFELAFTTRRGRNDAERCDWLRLRRINVGARSSLGVVRAQLVGRPRLRRSPGRSIVR